MKFKYLEHTADCKFQAFGKTLEEAFTNSALAMSNVMHPPEKIKPKIEKTIEVKGKDRQSLLYNFLEELLFLLDTEGFLLNKVKEIKIENNKLKAIIIGDSAENYEIHGAVKAVTYNDMYIKEEHNEVKIQVVVDL